MAALRKLRLSGRMTLTCPNQRAINRTFNVTHSWVANGGIIKVFYDFSRKDKISSVIIYK